MPHEPDPLHAYVTHKALRAARDAGPEALRQLINTAAENWAKKLYAQWAPVAARDEGVGRKIAAVLREQRPEPLRPPEHDTKNSGPLGGAWRASGVGRKIAAVLDPLVQEMGQEVFKAVQEAMRADQRKQAERVAALLGITVEEPGYEAGCTHPKGEGGSCGKSPCHDHEPTAEGVKGPPERDDLLRAEGRSQAIREAVAIVSGRLRRERVLGGHTMKVEMLRTLVGRLLRLDGQAAEVDDLADVGRAEPWLYLHMARARKLAEEAMALGVELYPGEDERALRARVRAVKIANVGRCENRSPFGGDQCQREAGHEGWHRGEPEVPDAEEERAEKEHWRGRAIAAEARLRQLGDPSCTVPAADDVEERPSAIAARLMTEEQRATGPQPPPEAARRQGGGT